MTAARVPNLFLAGAPKCGTTSLAYYLGQHPQVFTPMVKEPVFFGSDLTSVSRLDKAGYLAMFKDWAGETYAMDASTHYLYSKHAAGEVAAASPNAQIIVMVRNPVEAAHSMFHQLRFNGAEPLATFEASLAAETDRAANRIPIRFGFAENLLYREVYAFSRNIQRFEETFGADRIHVVFLEDLKSDPVRVVTALCEKITLDPAPVEAFSFETRNAAKRPRARWVNTLANYPPEWLRHFTRVFPKSLRIGVRQRMSKLNTAAATNPPLLPETRAFLAAEFAAEIDWLETRFDRDLQHWRV